MYNDCFLPTEDTRPKLDADGSNTIHCSKHCFVSWFINVLIIISINCRHKVMYHAVDQGWRRTMLHQRRSTLNTLTKWETRWIWIPDFELKSRIMNQSWQITENCNVETHPSWHLEKKNELVLLALINRQLRLTFYR